MYEAGNEKSKEKIGEKIQWLRMDDKKSSYVSLETEGDYHDRKDWQRQFEWLYETTVKFLKFFKPKILILDDSTSAVACYAAAEDKDIPVIFTAITDPVQAKLDSGNITGTSDKLPVEAQLDLIRQLQPDAKTIGIIYTTSEPNSVSAIAEYQAKAPEYGFEVDAVGVTSQAEVTQAADTLISHGVDCFSNLTDNNVVGVLAAVLEKTDEAGIPVYGSEVEQVKLGCVASAGIDYVQLGIQTGMMAAKVLTGETTCQDLPYETISEYGIYVNSTALDAMGITLPETVAQKAVESSQA